MPGIGHSSPVVWGDKVFITCADKDTARRIVLCLNSADGSIAWKREYNSFTFHMHVQNSYATSTPAVDDVGVYVTWTTPKEYTLLALSHDGKELWRQNLGEFTSQWGSGTSPVLVNDMVVLTNDQEGPESSVAAFDHKTGKQRWIIQRKSTDKTASSSPCLFTPKDGVPQLILTSKGNGIERRRPRDRAETLGNARPFQNADDRLADRRRRPADRHDRRRRQPPPTFRGQTRPQPIRHAGGRLRADQSARLRHDAALQGRPALHVLRHRHGHLRQADTGKKLWTEKPADSFFGSPVCAGDTLWCISHDGELVGISASDHYNLLSKLDLGEGSQATPAVAGGKMYLRTLSHLICIAKK